MKKILSIFLLAVLVMTIAVVAQPVNDEETEKEISAMESKSGAQIRLLQLEKAMERNILVGENTVESVLEQNPDANVTELNNALAELEVLKEEVAASVENMPDDANTTEVAEQFVTIKTEARQISQEFRENAQRELPEQARERVREQARNVTSEELEQKKEQIQQRIREHNAEQVQKVLQTMGAENETLVESVRNGEMNVGQAVSQVANQFRGLGEDQRENAKARLNEQKAKREVNRQAMMEKAQENIEDRMRQRSEERTQKVEQKLEEVRQSLSDRVPGFRNNSTGTHSSDNNTADTQSGSPDRIGGVAE